MFNGNRVRANRGSVQSGASSKCFPCSQQLSGVAMHVTIFHSYNEGSLQQSPRLPDLPAQVTSPIRHLLIYRESSRDYRARPLSNRHTLERPPSFPSKPWIRSGRSRIPDDEHLLLSTTPLPPPSPPPPPRKRAQDSSPPPPPCSSTHHRTRTRARVVHVSRLVLACCCLPRRPA